MFHSRHLLVAMMMLRSVVYMMKKKESRVFKSVAVLSQTAGIMAKKTEAISSFSAAGGSFLSLLRNPTSSNYSSSFGLILLTRRVDEGQPPASAGGMPESTLSTSDLVMI